MEKPIDLFNLALSRDRPWIDFTIELYDCVDLENYTVGDVQQLCLIDIQAIYRLGDVVNKYFDSIKLDDDNLENLKISGGKSTKENCSEFKSLLLDCTSQCKLNGTPLCFLTNGDDVILLRVRNYYETIGDIIKLDPKEVKLFDKWDVLVFKRDNPIYSIMTVLTSVLFDEYKRWLKFPAPSYSQVINWHFTDGSCDFKQCLDKVKYLISRKVFSILMDGKLELDGIDLRFSWAGDPDLDNLGKYGITPLFLNHLIGRITDNIKKSDEWKVFNAKQQPFRILDSSSFTVSKVFQNTIWYKHIGATTMRSIFNEETDGVLKIFDVSRMLCSYSIDIEYENGDSTKTDFDRLQEIHFQSFLKEVNVYQLLKRKDYLAQILSFGYLYIPDLKPTSLSKDIRLYENYLIGKGRELKTEAPFVFIEYIESVSMEELVNMDFDNLEEQAIQDLSEMHNMGILHRDFSSGNIIIKKSQESEIGYRVVFLDFGMSVILDTHQEENSHVEEKKREDLDQLLTAIYYYRYQVAGYKKQIAENDKNRWP